MFTALHNKQHTPRVHTHTDKGNVSLFWLLKRKTQYLYLLIDSQSIFLYFRINLAYYKLYIQQNYLLRSGKTTESDDEITKPLYMERKLKVSVPRMFLIIPLCTGKLCTNTHQIKGQSWSLNCDGRLCLCSRLHSERATVKAQ